MNYYLDFDNTLYETSRLSNDMLKGLAYEISKKTSISENDIFDELKSMFNRENIYNIFNKKAEKKVIKIKDIYLLNKFYKVESNKYNIVIFDNPQISFLKKTELLNNSTNVLLSECNLLGIKKVSKLIKIITKDIKKENINIIFNKYNSNSLDKEILYKIFKPIKILGKINYSKKIDTILNMEKIININSIRKDLLKISDNLLKENKIYGDSPTKWLK